MVSYPQMFCKSQKGKKIKSFIAAISFFMPKETEIQIDFFNIKQLIDSVDSFPIVKN